MAETPAATPPPHGGHETRDVKARLVVLFGVGVALLLGGSLALTSWLLGILHVTPKGYGPRGAPLAATAPRVPGPQLQTSPVGDMRDMQRAENALLQSYAWVDRSTGIARIPLEQAMALVAQQGLPSWPEVGAPAPQAPGPAQKESR